MSEHKSSVDVLLAKDEIRELVLLYSRGCDDGRYVAVALSEPGTWDSLCDVAPKNLTDKNGNNYWSYQGHDRPLIGPWKHP
jgi:hypothetical protein